MNQKEGEDKMKITSENTGTKSALVNSSYSLSQPGGHNNKRGRTPPRQLVDCRKHQWSNTRPHEVLIALPHGSGGSESLFPHKNDGDDGSYYQGRDLVAPSPTEVEFLLNTIDAVIEVLNSSSDDELLLKNDYRHYHPARPAARKA